MGAVLQDLMQEAPVGALTVSGGDELSAIHKPGCAAAIWQRQPLASFQAWIDALDPAQLPQGRVVLRPDRVREAVTTLCNDANTPEGPERTRLIDDIAAMAEMFAHVMGAPYLRVRLDAVTTNACRKFHVDVLTARLVCTYRGTGTQYGTGCTTGDPIRVFTVPTGSPIVMRGKRWPETPASGLLHRSPPIEGSGETRLLLVLDPISNLEETD